MTNPELQDLVDAPNETLDVECKAWLDLDDNAARAELAKHLCALANHGSGYVVFGISDDMTSAGEPPAQAGPYDRDSLSGIVKRYLTPAFQVEVYQVKSASTGVTHPVVWVPSHETVPVCSKRAGPHDDGKPVGIEQSTHYTREPGPSSVPATTPEGSVASLAKGRCVIRGLPVHLIILRWPDGPDCVKTSENRSKCDFSPLVEFSVLMKSMT